MIALPAFDLAKVLAAAAIAAAIFLAGMGTHKVFSDRKIARLEAAQAKQIAEWERRVSEAQAAARAQETKWRTLLDEARTEAEVSMAAVNQLNEEIQSANARIAKLDTSNRSLRNAAAAYAAGRGAADSLSSCQARADRLALALADGADLLGEGLELLAEGTELVRTAAKDADVRGAKLNACLKGWPQ